MHAWRVQAALEAWHTLLAAAIPKLQYDEKPPDANRERFSALAQPVLDMLACGAPRQRLYGVKLRAMQASPAAENACAGGSGASQRVGRHPLQAVLLTLVGAAHMPAQSALRGAILYSIGERRLCRCSTVDLRMLMEHVKVAPGCRLC